MAHLIDKDTLVVEIESYISNYKDILARTDRNDEFWADFVSMVEAKIDVLQNLLIFIDTLEVKEVDLNEEIEKCLKRHNMLAVGKKDFTDIAEHFFKLGMRVNNPITAADRGIAEEIIISLKQVENDYYIDQTKEIEWVRNKVKEEEV